jgi:hypothetical protein
MNFFETTACSPPMWSLHTDGGEACNGTTGDAMGVASTGTGVFSPPQSGSVVIGTRSAPVPEPGTLGLTVAGLVSLIGLRKRRSIGAPDRPVREPSA